MNGANRQDPILAKVPHIVVASLEDLEVRGIVGKELPQPFVSHESSLNRASGRDEHQVLSAVTNRIVDIAPIEAAVAEGTQTLDDYEAWILAHGYGPADAALLRARLASQT